MSLLTPPRSPAQVLGKTLLFNSVQPCRVVDTRSAAAGLLIASVPRTFDVVGATTNYSAQGGVAGGCGVPGFVAGLPRVQAVAVNVVAVDPAGEGFLTAWPTDQAFPPASTVNFQKLAPNLNVANGVIVPVRQNAQGGDITIVAGGSNAHVIVDITGYFSKAEPRKFYLTNDTVFFRGAEALTACAAGFHMASLREVFDTSHLVYDTARGFTMGDSGSGPPTQAGWIRTGGPASNSTIAGLGNCNNWTTNTGTFHGTTGLPFFNWTATNTMISPWSASAPSCGSQIRVWCVED